MGFQLHKYTIMNRFFLFCSLVFSVVVFSQQNEATIDIEKLNVKVSTLINNHRKTLKLKELQKENSLQKAAEDHSLYLLRIGILSHFQKETEKKNPDDRVRFYNGKNFSTIGENVLFTTIEPKKYSDSDLDKLAIKIFNQWKNSPLHYKNIIHADFDTADLGFAIDLKRNRIYATQVFGIKGISIENQLSENAFGLKEKKGDCKKISLSTQLSIGNNITIENDKVVLYFHDKQEFEQLFSNENDGIAIDFIEKEQMSCASSNKFDISPIYDGVLAKPVFRNELLENNIAKNEFKLITTVGKVPSHLIGKDILANVVLIFDNCACEYVVPLKVNSDTIDLFQIEPILENPKNTILNNKGIIYTNEITFEFDKNKIKPINSYFYNINHKVHSIQIYSYSSVEGNEVINSKLHNERAVAIEKFANDSLNIKLKPSLKIAQENWEMCYLQLAMENLDEWIDKPKKEIRNYVNTNQEYWNNYLNAQRTSKLVVNYYGELTNDIQEIDYETTFAELNLRTAIFEKNNNKAIAALEKLYQVEHTDCLFEELIFNEIKTNAALVQNAAAVLSNNLNNDFKVIQFLKIWLEKFDSLSIDSQHNLLVLYCKINKDLLENWDISTNKLTNVTKPKTLENHFSKFKSNQKLQSNFDYILLYYSNHINDYSNINTYFNRVYSSFKSNCKTKEDRLKLALFLNHWTAYQYSVALLLPEINKPTFSKEEALLLAQTATVLFDDSNTKQNQQILNKVYQLNKKEWCEWQKKNFNLMRNKQIKDDFCKKCNNL